MNKQELACKTNDAWCIVWIVIFAGESTRRLVSSIEAIRGSLSAPTSHTTTDQLLVQCIRKVYVYMIGRSYR